jgi:hypothetical protein
VDAGGRAEPRYAYRRIEDAYYTRNSKSGFTANQLPATSQPATLSMNSRDQQPAGMQDF